MKQTAVEWLYEELWKQTDFSLPNNIFKQAKEMERQQIIDARTDIYTTGDLSAQDYYNKTYNK